MKGRRSVRNATTRSELHSFVSLKSYQSNRLFFKFISDRRFLTLLIVSLISGAIFQLCASLSFDRAPSIEKLRNPLLPLVKTPSQYAEEDEQIANHASELTMFTTAAKMGFREFVAVRSWLAIGARVVLMVNAANETRVPEWVWKDIFSSYNDENNRDELNERNRRAIRVVDTPRPFSEPHGLPRLDMVLQHGDDLARTKWACFINSEIVVFPSFGTLPSRLVDQVDPVVVGGRLDCSINFRTPRDFMETGPTYHDLQKPFQHCAYHGHGGKDYFMFRKGFFQRNSFVVLPFYLGRPIWDNWLLHNINQYGIDATPTTLVVHLRHALKWFENAPDTETFHNEQLALCDKYKGHPREKWVKSLSRCHANMSTYNLPRQLCPLTNVGAMPPETRWTYSLAVYYTLVDAKQAKIDQVEDHWQKTLDSGLWSQRLGCPPNNTAPPSRPPQKK